MTVEVSQEYSSSVRLFLETSGRSFSVAQVRDGWLLLRNPAEISDDTSAQLVIVIDGDSRAKKIVLPDGASRDSRWVRFHLVPEYNF